MPRAHPEEITTDKMGILPAVEQPLIAEEQQIRQYLLQEGQPPVTTM
jgi:hypothetical protein